MSGFFVLSGITGAHALLETARDALFLARLPASRLGVMYLAVAALGWLASRFAHRRLRRGGTLRLLLAACVTGALALLLYAAWPAADSALVHALYLWTALFAALAVAHFWLDLAACLTITQAKRLFGVIGAGGVTGALCGALLARAIVPAFEDARALVITAAGLLAATAVGPARALAACTPAASGEADAPSPREPHGWGLLALVRRDPYLTRLLALIVISTVALTLTEYVFKATAARTVARAELPAFFATVQVGLNALALVVQFVGVGLVLRALGLRALLLVPALTMATALGFVATVALLPALLMKGAEGALRHSLHRTSVELCFVPLARQLRARVKPLFDLLGQRGGQAAAALLILLLSEQAGGLRLLAVCVAATSGVWLVVAAPMRSHYLDLFRRTLDRGEFEPNAPFPAEDLVIAASDGEAREQALRSASLELDLLLSSSEPSRRDRALVELRRLQAADFGLPLHRGSLLHAADRELRAAGACLDARVVLESTASAAALCQLLGDEEQHARARLLTLVALAHPDEDVERIRRGLASGDPELRASSRELCEDVLSTRIRRPFLLYFDDLSDSERSARLTSLYELRARAPIDALRLTQRYPGALASMGARLAAELGLSLVEERPADLSGRMLDELDLRGTNLRGALLVGASLRGARLEDCDLSGADLERADLEGAWLERANLDTAHLGGARFHGVRATATVFRRCRGTGTEFVNSHLEDADFGHAALTAPSFSQSLLLSTRFFCATLPGAVFRNSILRSAVLDGASLAGATFHHCVLDDCSLLDVASEEIRWVRSQVS